MAAIVGEERSTVAGLCQEFDVEAANFNAPGQIIISGEKTKIQAAVAAAFDDQPVGIGDPVATEAFPQVFGFAHVKHQAGGIVHQINAGAIRQVAKKIMAQPLDQRSRIGEQQCL